VFDVLTKKNLSFFMLFDYPNIRFYVLLRARTLENAIKRLPKKLVRYAVTSEDQMCVFPNTLNRRTGKFVIPLVKEDLEKDIEDLSKIADYQRTESRPYIV